MKLSQPLKSLLATLIAVSAVSLVSAPAMADQIFNFTFSGANESGFGELNTVSNGDGSFTAISGTGTTTVFGATNSIALVFNPAGTGTTFPVNGLYYDNQVFPSNTLVLDNGGLLFSSPVQQVNLFANAGVHSYFYLQQDGLEDAVSFTLTAASAVPEPTSALLFGLGLMGVAAMRRKNDKA